MRCTEPNKVWKSFHDNPLSHSEAHYVMTVLSQQNDKGFARASDIVKALKISAPTASQGLKALVKKGWLQEDSEKHFTVAKDRIKIVEQIKQNKALLMDFFVTILGLSKEEADRDSCKMEHLLSPEAAEKLEQFLHKQHGHKTKTGGLPVLN